MHDAIIAKSKVLTRSLNPAGVNLVFSTSVFVAASDAGSTLISAAPGGACR